MGRDPTKQYTSKPSKKAMKTAKKAFQKQREGAQQTIKQQRKEAKRGEGPYASSYKATTVKKPTTTKKTKVKDTIISGGKTLAELKYLRDILSGNWLGVGKNVLGTIGVNKLLGDQAYLDDEDSTGLKSLYAGGPYGFDDLAVPYHGSNYDYSQGMLNTPDKPEILNIAKGPYGFDDLAVPYHGSNYDYSEGMLNTPDKPEILNFKRKLVANGGLINLFKYGGFLG